MMDKVTTILDQKTKKVTTSRGDRLDQGTRMDTHCFQLIIAMALEVGLHSGIPDWNPYIATLRG